jgi:hypothetical protein
LHIPSEFRLVAACCAWPPSTASDRVVRDWPEPVDWTRLGRIAARHRVEGLVHGALTRSGRAVPSALSQALAAEALDIARTNLRFVAEAARLGKLLGEARIDFLFLKGVTLNILAYGTLGVKKSVDIDVAVEPAAYRQAIGALRTAGYRCVEPEGDRTDEEILRSVQATKHSAWRRGASVVELHAQLVDSPLMLPSVGVRSPRQDVEVSPGIVLPTLAPEELFAYLCVHGATHAWSRLKWIADVGALVAEAGDAELERLYRRSVELGAGRSGGQALLLCADLLGRRLPPALERELRADRALVYLARVALKAMTAGGAEAELDDRILGTLELHLSHFRLIPGWGYKAAELRRKLGWRAGGGGSGLLASLLTGPRWLARRARTARERGNRISRRH